MTTFASRLKRTREASGISQADLARRVDPKKKQSFISNFETGARSGTSSIIEIAHALGVDAYWLKTGKGDQGGRAVATFESSEISEDDANILKALASMAPPRAAYWRKKIISEAELEELERVINAPTRSAKRPKPKHLRVVPRLEGETARGEAAENVVDRLTRFIRTSGRNRPSPPPPPPREGGKQNEG